MALHTSILAIVKPYLDLWGAGEAAEDTDRLCEDRLWDEPLSEPSVEYWVLLELDILSFCVIQARTLPEKMEECVFTSLTNQLFKKNKDTSFRILSLSAP